MRIPIDETYVMTSDENNFILAQVVTAKTGKNKGKKTDRAVSYHSYPSGVLSSYYNRRLRASKAESFEELLSELKRIDKVVQEKLDLTKDELEER